MIQVADSVAPLSAAELARARAYLYGALAWSAGAQLWTLALLAIAFYSGASTLFAAWLRRRLRSAWLVTAAMVTALFSFVLTGLLPISFYLDFIREAGYGFERQSPAAWFGDWALVSLLTVVIGLVVIEIAYGWLRRARAGGQPRLWWLRLWIVIAAAVVVAVAIDPLLEPLLDRFTPVENPVIRADIAALARRAGIPNARIEEVNASRRSGHTNAYVVGLLGTQRIVLYDTMLQDETPAEIEFVVGHEIGHYVLHHIWKGVAFTAAFLLGAFALLGWFYPRWSRGLDPADIAGLPLMLLILLGLTYVSAPLTNGFSRWEEHQADAYGLHLTPAPCAAVASFEREERTDLIDPNPPRWIVWWFFNHPDQQSRIAFARRFCSQNPPAAAGKHATGQR